MQNTQYQQDLREWEQFINTAHADEGLVTQFILSFVTRFEGDKARFLHWYTNRKPSTSERVNHALNTFLIPKLVEMYG